MRSLEQHVGHWSGSNAFALMPADPPHVADATAQISTAAAGNLAMVAYTWSHPDDGAQDGLLVIGPGTEHGAATAFWGDSWHQRPQPTLLTGEVRGGLIVASYEYSDEWRWQITLDATVAGAVTLRMENAPMESAAALELAAGPYTAMLTTLRRASSTTGG
jgi:hypothetical protein